MERMGGLHTEVDRATSPAASPSCHVTIPPFTPLFGSSTMSHGEERSHSVCSDSNETFTASDTHGERQKLNRESFQLLSSPLAPPTNDVHTLKGYNAYFTYLYNHTSKLQLACEQLRRSATPIEEKGMSEFVSFLHAHSTSVHTS